MHCCAAARRTVRRCRARGRLGGGHRSGATSVRGLGECPKGEGTVRPGPWRKALGGPTCTTFAASSPRPAFGRVSIIVSRPEWDRTWAARSASTWCRASCSQRLMPRADANANGATPLLAQMRSADQFRKCLLFRGLCCKTGRFVGDCRPGILGVGLFRFAFAGVAASRHR